MDCYISRKTFNVSDIIFDVFVSVVGILVNVVYFFFAWFYQKSNTCKCFTQKEMHTICMYFIPCNALTTKINEAYLTQDKNTNNTGISLCLKNKPHTNTSPCPVINIIIIVLNAKPNLNVCIGDSVCHTLPVLNMYAYRCEPCYYGNCV